MSKFKECWVIDRDEYGEPYGVSGYSEVADLGEVKLCYEMLIDGKPIEKEEVFEDWIHEQEEGFGTEFYVFQSLDCFTTKEEAEKALKKLQNAIVKSWWDNGL